LSRKQVIKKFKKLATPKRYVYGSVILLGLTSIYWSLLGAWVNQRNADQLADPAILNGWHTLNEATFPLQHTFLFKWPLFALINVFNNASVAYYVLTVLVSLTTVALLAYVLSKIEKRPYVLGLIYFALASVLLYVPIEPAAGSLLPVGLSMLATRNLEYIVYIVAVLGVCKVPRFKPERWWFVSVGLLGVLFASDQFFVGLSFGGAGLCLLLAIVAKHKVYRTLALRWLTVSCAGLVVALLLLAIIQLTGLTNLSRDVTGPYGVGISLSDKLIALAYSALGIATNFGANPIYDSLSLTQTPKALLLSFASSSIIGFIINFLVFITVIIASMKLCRMPFNAKRRKLTTNQYTLLSIALLASSLTAIGLFVATNHYYPADARYLAISFFAGFIALATYASKHYKARLQLPQTAVLLLAIIIGIPSAYHAYRQSIDATQTIAVQNQQVATTLQYRPVKTLLADYWRVYPITQLNNKVTPYPLQDCTIARDVLASKAWQQGALKKSFAYLLTTARTGTGFNGCSLDQIKAAYGAPSDSVVIAGTIDHPTTMLLFYDKGINKKSYPVVATPVKTTEPTPIIVPATPAPKPTAPAVDNTLIRNLSDLRTDCTGRSVLQISAHEDDDILFMNPDLIGGIRNGDCIHSIYLTAGDAGSDAPYWLGREEGSKAAYADALGSPNAAWFGRDIRTSNQSYLKIAQLSEQGRPTSLGFMRLPDGNINGRGFKSHNNQSLARLNAGTIGSMRSVDGSSVYTKEMLINTLVALMNAYQPALVRTQAATNLGTTYPDHSDHVATGRLVQEAFRRYQGSSTIQYYVGYPIRERAENVSNELLAAKQNMFFTYGSRDPSTCNSIESCAPTAYSYYLTRQYTTGDF
jgi:LmbE family N-acetylglucosaminyl deacetylase